MSCRLFHLAALVVVLSTGAAVGAPSHEPFASKTKRDLDGRVHRAETGGFKVTLAFGGDDIQVFLTTPGLISSARLVCTANDTLVVPAEMTCEHGRKLSFRPIPTGYQVTLGGTLASEARAYLGNREYGPQGPTVYEATRVHPIDVAFLDHEFGAPGSSGNSSPETNVLRGLVRERPPLSAVDVRRVIDSTLEAEGIDPMTVPLEVVFSIRRALGKSSSQLGVFRVLDRAAERAAANISRRAQLVPKPGP